MNNAIKKGLMLLVLAALVATGAFAQRVGDTVTVSGKEYRIEEVRNDGRLLLQFVPSLNGVWVCIFGNATYVETINGSTGTYTELSGLQPRWQDALNRGLISIGGQSIRNLRSTGNLTWSGQMRSVTFNNRAPNVATGTTWINCTITLSADGQTFVMRYTTSFGDQAATYTRRQ